MITMAESKKSTVAYRCPHCTKAIFGILGFFSLRGDLIKLKCDCGESELTVMPMADEKLRLLVPCLLCGKEHRYILTKEALCERSLLPLACPYTGLEIAYIGEHGQVSAAIDAEGERLQKVLDSAGIGLGDLRSDGGREPYEDADNLGDAVHFLLCELDADNKIDCYCRESGEIPLYNYQLLSERVRIYCECCNAEVTLPLHSVGDAEALLQIDELHLK